MLCLSRWCEGTPTHTHPAAQVKLELAQLGEQHVITRRELYKSKEANMKLASKMTKLEMLLYEAKRR